ncbi:hypothetical protein [Streptomyces pilosus]|uniref:Uncharacterized protein n=1 Tax=Streptomyces pilosus TaxID=28893 RepID=A0A918C442_9ACTN|nr:hypothetical protein [Streptomyces pilosus]GGR02721.1 hypothetical protein GCM10010280_58530 [Streptomyces pilosus]
MTNQPYGGYDPYQQQPEQPRQQPYQQQPQHQQPQHQQSPSWPGQQQGYDDPYADQQYTQQWQGQTWETQMQPPVTAAAEETSYLPPQQPVSQPQPQPRPVYQPQPQPHAQPQPVSQPQPQQQPVARSVAQQEAGPEYGPATLGGNSRVTDAQRARAEGRSPIIDPGMQPAVLTAVLGLLLAGGAALGTYALLVPLVVLQAVTAAGWFRLNGMWPARQGIALGFLGALAADAALLASDRSPAAIIGTLGVWVLLSLVLQLRSHADPDERMYGLMATVAAAALAIAAGGYLAADADAVTAGAVAVAAAIVARALPLPTAASVVAALAAAAAAGFAVGGMDASGAATGAGAAVCALIGHRVAAYDYPSRFVHFTAGVALPLAAAGPAVHVLGRVFA